MSEEPEKTVTLQITVPPEWTPGDKLRARLPGGVKVGVTAPASTQVGDTLEFELPASILNEDADGEEEAPPPVVVEAPVVESTALAVVPGSPADESYDFFGDASRPESPARIAWEPPPRAPPKRVYMPKRRTRRPPVSRVPWSLLDELDAEKEKFAMQQVGDTFKDRFEAADAKKKRVRQRFVE